MSGMSSFGSLFSLLLVIGMLFGFLTYQMDIRDWLALRNYQPPAAVKQLADETTMNEYGRKVFYVNQPELSKKTEFITNCPESLKEHTIVLGCYHGNQQGIFLLDVDDPRLNGVEQVTAAHEMLHAAYERLDDSKRAEVDSMLKSYYENQLSDERIKKTIDAYRESEPNDLINEMHSIFGTEIRTLPQPLEDYYKEYFSSRLAVVELSERYQAEFTSRQQAVQSYDSQLAEMKVQIESNKKEIDIMQAEIDSRRSTLERYRNSNNVDVFNAGVPVFNALVDRYNGLVNETKSLISQYNALVAKRNAIAIEQDQLVEQLKGNSESIQ